MKPLIVLTTIGENHDARKFATALVSRRLAACVSIVPNVISVYRWEGKIERDYEQLFVIKTAEEKVDALREYLFELHPYQIPEFVVLPIDRIEGPYLEWMTAAVTEP